MTIDLNMLRREERIALELSCLFKKRGYKEYRMGAFEEYSVYMDNKDFLLSKNMAVFGGPDGKLYALRPDVTLSVVKNTGADGARTEKYFYNEKVYRLEKGSKSYKEVSQIGAEVIGQIDCVTQAEVAVLILKTLRCSGENFLLDVSHMGFVGGLLSYLNAEGEQKERLMGYLKEKNAHDFEKYAEQIGIAPQKAEVFKKAMALGGPPKKALAKARELAENEEMISAVNELEKLFGIVDAAGVPGKINVNFSIANNADYYNGVIFNGYVRGVPKPVLSGGRYDKLAEKFGRNVQAIGFALYLGELGARLKEEREKTDVLLVCGDGREAEALRRAEELNEKGKIVKIVKSAEGEDYREAEYI